MSKSQKWMFFINAFILPIIPLLFLYNQNSQYLYLPQIVIVSLILIFIVVLFYILCRFVFKSELFAYLACLFLVILLFAHNSICEVLIPYELSSISLLLMVPLLSYILTYIFYKIFNKVQFEKLSFLITVFAFMMLGMNLYPLFQNEEIIGDGNLKFRYKSSFITDDKLLSPNIYWIFCDGMLGFDSMETYFRDSQEDLTLALKDRGFGINKGAMLETGHLTRIAIPTLMCPDYYDEYLDDILSNHEAAMELRNSSDSKLYSARVNNETINAFDEKGYTTVTISIDDRYFLPTTDYFYYIDAQYKSSKDYYTVPNLVKKSKNDDKTFNKSRIYAHQLGDIFLGGIPSVIYDKLFSSKELTKQPISTSFENTSEILLGSTDGKINSALVNSLYDSLHSKDIVEPKFIIIHDFMSHFPFNLDENGDMVNEWNNILSYPGQHTYATRVLVNLVDMILNADPYAVIVLQADHGLHVQSEEQIIEGLGDECAPINIWNNVFSAIRVPEQYQNGDEHYPMNDPRNISRYLINSFVGNNYRYVEDK